MSVCQFEKVELFQVEQPCQNEVLTHIPKQCQEPWNKLDTMSSTQPLLMDIIQVFCWLSDGLSTFPESYILKTMGRNRTQPRLENRISKQVSAWTLKFVFFKTTSSNICLALYIKLFSMRLAAVQSYKGVQHLFERNIKLF